MRYVRRGSLVCLLGLLAASTLRADDLTTLTGKKMAGKLVAVDAQGVTFSVGGAEVKVPAKEVLLLDLGNKVAPPAKDAKWDEVELTDGSVLKAAKFLVKGRKLDLAFPGAGGPAADLPLAAVFSVMRGADDPKHRDDWKKMLAGRGKRDLYVIRQADGLNFLPGTLVEGTEAGDAVTFEREDGTRSTLKLARATGGLVFTPPPAGAIPPTLCKVYDTAGNVLFAQSVGLSGGAVTVKTVAGATVTYPSVQGVAKLDYAQGNVAYLSDLEPQVSAPPPEPGEPQFTYLRDKNQVNAPLQFGKETFPKGLWVCADTALTYTIGGDYREFKALVGADESIPNPTTAVKVTVEGDGKVLFTDTLRRADKPKTLNLDVKGVKVLKIAVEADTPYNGNQVILADAKVQK